MNEVFFQISVILLAATAAAIIAKRFHQPVITAYIIAGVIIGPAVFGLLHDSELLHSLSTFGIAFLLFLVGVELDLRAFLRSGKVALLAGFAQLTVAIGVSWLVIRQFDFSPTAAIVLACAMAFSSTIFAVKSISERKELDSLYGQIVIGILLAQDFFAAIVLLLVPILIEGSSGAELALETGVVVMKAALLFAIALLAARYILTPIFRYLATSAELLLLGAICWCLIFCMVSIQLGLSIEIGALLAGISLSFLPFSTQIESRVSSLRDFFLPIFFAVLGSQLIFSSASSVYILMALLGVVVIILTPLVVISILLLLGYRSRVAFMTGIAIGQVSEFSFVLVSMGYEAQIFDRNILSVVALLGLLSITISSYAITYADQLYAFLRPLIKRFERTMTGVTAQEKKKRSRHIVIFGGREMGMRIAHSLSPARRKKTVFVDYDPHVIAQLNRKDYECIYGTMNDPDILAHAGVEHAAIAISTVHDRRGTNTLLEYKKQYAKNTRVIVTAFSIEDAVAYYKAGADYVLHPAILSTEFVAELLSGRKSVRAQAHREELEALAELLK